MKNKSRLWSLTIICVIFGVLTGLQFKAHRNTPHDYLPSRRIDYLISRLYYLEEENKKLKEEGWSLRQKLTEITGGHSNHAVKDAAIELDKQAMIMSGLSPVEGPGVIVVLKEGARMNVKESSDLFLIHAEDLLNIFNDIFSAGAEAVSINGQRITAISHILCNGPTISINNTKIAPPFEIKAIGNPQQIEDYLNMRGSYLDTLKSWKVEVKITKHNTIKIPAYIGSLQFKYVAPAKDANSG